MEPEAQQNDVLVIVDRGGEIDFDPSDWVDLDGVSIDAMRKSSIEGHVVEYVVTILGAAGPLIFARDIILRKMKDKRIGSIRLGDFEAVDADKQTVEKLFELYEKSSKEGGDIVVDGSR